MLMTTTHISHPASPAISVSRTHAPAQPIPCKPSPLRRLCKRPKLERPLLPTLRPVLPTHRAETTFRETIDFAFLPGDTRNVIDLSVPNPTGKSLHFQHLRLMTDLPTGQHALVTVGTPLVLDASGDASIDFYNDQKTPLNALITRDSNEGTGKMTLEVTGRYEDLP